MKGPRAIGSPAGSPGSVDLCLAGLPPPVSRRPSSASAAKPITRSISMVTGGAPGRKAPEAPGPRGSQAANNLRRSNSTTQVNQSQADHAWTGPRRPTEPPDSLLLSEGSPSERKRLAGPSRTSSEKGATWNILDDRPMAFSSPPDAQSPSALDVPAGPRRRECTVPLAPTFTANNRSSKGAVGNCVTTMVHNRYPPSEKAPPPPKSSNHTAPSLNNIVKATTGEGESCSFGKAQKNVARSSHAVQSNSGGATGQLRRKEVTEEEAERFIHQVNQAAVTIQRWYRHQVQRRRAGAASVQRLLESKRAGQRQRLGEGTLLEQHQQKEAARRRAREEKARQARRAAIQELQQKRAQKSGDTDLGLLKGTRETGKPQPTQELPLSPGSTAQETRKASNAGAGLRAAGPEDPCQPAPDTALEPQQFPEDKPQDASSQDTAAGEILEVVAPTEGRVKSRATLDDLLDTLKLLEQEPEPLPRPRAYRKDKYAWTDEEDYASSLTAHNLERFGRLSVAASPPEDGALLSEAKLRSILRFLDETEESGQRQAAPAPQGHVPEEGLGCSGPVSEASTSAMRLQLEVEEKKQAMVLLQRALAQQRDLTVRRVKETEKELGRQLRQQREHYEATIQRHLSFIDQLIEDKKALGEKCEALVAELKQGDQRRKDRETQMQEQHELEIKKLKELMSATEKVRREKWISEKTRKIKEITVKGLEPEIQKLIARHKQEVKKLKSLHAAELLQADERAAERYGRQAEELRQHLEREKEALGRQEWERAQQRFEQHLEQEQRALEQQRRRLHSEVAEEKERLGQQAARQRAELEELRQQLEESSSAGGRALRAEFEKRREEQERRHRMELKALKDQLEVEKQMWEANSAKKEEAWLLSRERELKEEVRRGRDEEIERVVRRLEADMTLAREESERAAESRLEQLTREKQAELEEVHGRVKVALAKKEEAVNSLRKQHEAAMKRADHLEELLEQHGRPFPSTK
nr:centrosomal protein of 131 kDa [Vicugna pacos]